MDILESPTSWTVTPKPGFCAKLFKKASDKDTEKIFFNFCVCNELPGPAEDVDEDGLSCILESSDPGKYRIPISIGEPHSEEDKRGQPCTAYDVILNEDFYEKRVKGSELFRAFLILVAIDGVESKYGVEKIDRQNWIVLKNRRYVGELQTQRIRKQPRPMIEEIDRNGCGSGGTAQRSSGGPTQQFSGGTIQESDLIKPKYEIRKDDATNPTKVTAIFFLDGLKTASDIVLEIGEHRIRVAVEAKSYQVDVFVPMSLNEDLAKAQLHADDGKFVVDIPLR